MVERLALVFSGITTDTTHHMLVRLNVQRIREPADKIVLENYRPKQKSRQIPQDLVDHCEYVLISENTVKHIYNDHQIGYLSAFWSLSRWPRAT